VVLGWVDDDPAPDLAALWTKESNAVVIELARIGGWIGATAKVLIPEEVVHLGNLGLFSCQGIPNPPAELTIEPVLGIG
jgi:hypothetical protein